MLSEKCDGESECTLFGNLNGLLGDPCVKNHKYLEYDYECDFTSENQRSSFCEVNLENRTDSINCPDGKQINISNAVWGRAKDQL